ncbi:hypothetical protein ACYJ51_29900, partial [Klebsiella pneumoniae]
MRKITFSGSEYFLNSRLTVRVFYHLSDSIHNRLRAISPDLHVRCASYLFLPVIHTELKTGDLKNHFPAYILQLV